MIKLLGWLMILAGGYGLYRSAFIVFEYLKTIFYAGSRGVSLSADAVYGFVSIFLVILGVLFLIKSR